MPKAGNSYKSDNNVSPPPPQGCTDAVPVGDGSGRRQMFVDAYNRGGGRGPLGCTINGAHWWGDGGDRTVVIQDFSGGAAGDTAIIHDEKRDNPPNSTPAYVIHGGIWSYYLGLGGWESWLGPPTSDEFENATGQAQSNFANGYINYNGGNPQAVRWPSAIDGQWHGEYHNGYNLNNYPTWVQNTTTLSYDWGEGAPGGGRWGVLPANFSARWTNRATFDAGTYRFTAAADDGIRVWVDGALLIDKWQDQPYTQFQADIQLAAGKHDVKVEYYDTNGAAAVAVNWGRLADPIPTAPTYNTPIVTQSSVTIRWNDLSNNEEGFKIYRWRGEDQTWPLIGTVGAGVTQFTDTNVKCSDGYSYAVTAYNRNGESALDQWVDGFTSPCSDPDPSPSPTPEPPTSLNRKVYLPSVIR